MCLNNLIMPILCFIFAARFCIVSAQKCGDSLYFIPNGTYDTNRRLVLSILAANVGSTDGFYNTSVGEGPESIYVMGLCIPGTETKVCSDCIQGASDALLQKCTNETDSFQWRGNTTLCFVRYSSHMFFDSMDLEPTDSGISSSNLTGDVTEFNRIWVDFMTRMITAASSSTPGSLAQRHYAADISRLTGFPDIYALMQCIPGITSGDCKTCLYESVSSYQNCCSGKQGGSIQTPSCIFRWDIYAYLGAFVNKNSPLPPSPQVPPIPPPNGGKKFPIWGIVVLPIALAALLVIAALGFNFYCKKMRKKKKIQSYKPMQHESKFGTNPESSSSYAKTNADLLDRNFTNSPMDGKVKPPNIQVFVNFRGDELRNNFVGHLVDALRRNEINVFIDNQEQRGEDLNILFKRIEDSGIAIVVFSSRYTESTWCLEELVKIKERVQQGLLKVLPIFYKVTPEIVKRLKGEFGDNFREKEYHASDEPKKKRWGEAIVFVTQKFARTFDEKSSEIEFIENIVKDVLKMLQSISTVESGQSSH